MTTRPVTVGSVTIGGGAPLVLIGGPCAIENERHALMTAERLAGIAADCRVPFIYKSSYDKANRSSVNGYRGPGLIEGLRVLRKVRETLRVPVLSDVHQVSEVDPAAEVLDVIQIPAFLCRQTDLVLAAAARIRSVCRQRNAGIWMTSSTSAAGSTSLTWWTSESTGTLKVSRTLRRMRSPSTSPGPR